MSSPVHKDPALQALEKKIWNIVLLAIVVILFLTLTLLGLQFISIFGQDDSNVFSDKAYRFSVFLATLVLLFCAYMIAQQRKLLQVSRNLSAERDSAKKFKRDFKTLSALMALSTRINSKQQLPRILDMMTREIVACFEADQASIMLMDQKHGNLKTLSTHGSGSDLVKDALVPLGSSIAGQVVASGRPLLLNGRVCPSQFPGTPAKERNISSALCSPLKIGKTTIGVLNVNLVDRAHTFTQNDLDLVTLFANNAAVTINNAALFKDRRQRIKLQTLFEQLHSPPVARALVNTMGDPRQPSRIRKKMTVSILFGDIRGFSGMMNAVALEDVMDFLDAFYDRMAKVVSANKGSLDKFIGDEVMAFFGAPETLESSVTNALGAAREMVREFDELKDKFSERSPFFKQVGIGLGVHTGEVFVGNVGSARHYAYTVIGNAVNLSRRLCSGAKPGQILVSENTINKLHGMATSRFHTGLDFKGITGRVNAYELAA